MQKAQACLSAFLALQIVFWGCGRDRTTTIMGKVIDTSAQPVANVPISIAGDKGLFAREVDLQTVVSDKQGFFSITFKPDDQYRSLDVANLFHRVPSLYSKYKNFEVTINNSQTSVCCPAEIGVTTEFSYTLTP